VCSKGAYDPNGLWKRLNLGREIVGKRVLDLDERDGSSLFNAKHWGADVVAVDYVDKDGTGFAVAAQLRQSSVPSLTEISTICAPPS